MSAALLVALGLIAIGHPASAALHQDWWLALLPFAIGAASAALPRQYPLIVSFAALLVFAWFSSHTPLPALTYFCFIFGGLSFGLSVRSTITLMRTSSSWRPGQ